MVSLEKDKEPHGPIAGHDLARPNLVAECLGQPVMEGHFVAVAFPMVEPEWPGREKPSVTLF